MPRVALVHFGRHHFEIVLALFANLRVKYRVALWSNFLHVFDRRDILEHLGLALFNRSDDYDAVVIISGEETPNEDQAGPELWGLMSTKPIVRIMHRLGPVELPGELRLFPKAVDPFIPVSTGLADLKQAASHKRRSLLIQGNVENRRNYGLLPALVRHFPNITFDVVGIKSGAAPEPASNLRVQFDQTEQSFHSICANSSFILPLIDPKLHPGYFTDRFSSSVLIGFAYGLPFIAHTSLFELYPIVGFPYSTNDELLRSIGRASTCDGADYAAMAHRMAENRLSLERSNLEAFAWRLPFVQYPR